MEKVDEKQCQKLSSAMHLIYKRIGNIQKEMDSIFPEGISYSEISVLSFVSDNKDAFLKEISENLNLPSSTLTSVIDRLEKRGLVHRVVSKRNRRSYSLELTKDGIRISDLHKSAEKKMWNKLLEGLKSDSDREKLIELLETISRIL